MKAKHLLDDITFTENEPIDVSQLNRLYQLIGWDTNGRRTDIETAEMLRVSHYHIAAHTFNGLLVGFDLDQLHRFDFELSCVDLLLLAHLTLLR